MKMLDAVIGLIDKIEAVLAVAFLAGIVAVMSLQVTMRYVFHSPLTWAQELSMLLMIYLSFFAIDLAYRRNAHIGIDFFLHQFPAKIQKVISIVVSLLLLVFLVVIFWKSLLVVKMQARHEIAGVLPLSKSFWILPVSLVFPSMILSTMQTIFRQLQPQKGAREQV